jgi:hypothetical protein
MARRKTQPESGVCVERLALSLKPMRRGSLTERRTKCGKARCSCHTDPEARHGPYFSLTRVVGGKTKSRWIALEQVEVVRRQLADGDRFRREVEAYWEACEAEADAELETGKEASPEEAEKGGSRRRLPAALRRKSSSS